ncbi:DUF1947 domain-containing protein [Promethearchaeum syntrophicum]|uniref:DUF1947 domain-containing protein n=1 Tax=Promethearchaeum syntrophicum TaxID=2594042 RepID=A0A5B9D9K4_9ARCH|nr:DUF1947 domain-containing protein [Candidatus Prometheoarchaeum syntrophicum]QEE15879.1 putative tRNA pseudouridine synthase B [Candidatus Prometheoarchaeum syntrophicum]
MPKDLTIRQRHFLKSKDKKIVIDQFKSLFPGKDEEFAKLITPKTRIEWIKLDQNQVLYAIDNVLTFWLKGDKIIPLLSYLMKNPNPFKFVKVDQGAIKFVSKGANVMRPGITTIDPTIKKGDIVTILDPQHDRVLSVGESLYNAEEMEKLSDGKVIKCVHSLTDNIWLFSKNFD